MDSTYTPNTPETAIIWKLGLQDHPYASLYAPTLLLPYQSADRTRSPPHSTEAPSSNAVAVSSSTSTSTSTSTSSIISDKTRFEDRTDTKSEKPSSQKCADGHNADLLCTTKRNHTRDVIQENEVSGNNTNIRKRRRISNPWHTYPDATTITAVESSAVADTEKRIDSSAIAEAAKKNNDSNENEKTDNIVPFIVSNWWSKGHEPVLPPTFVGFVSESRADEEASPLYEKVSTPKTAFTNKYKNKEATTKLTPTMNAGKIVTASNKVTQNVPFLAPGADPLNRSKMADSIKKLPAIDDYTGWLAMYSELVRYKNKHGTAIVPLGDKTYPDLSRWVTSQIDFYECFTLPKKCKDLLFEIGFPFELATTKSELKWEAMCQRYKFYRANNAKLVVYWVSSDDPELFNWINNARNQVRKNSMTEARQKMLKQLDFKLDFRHNDPWDVMLNQLKAFVERHGELSERALMRENCDNNITKLRNWVRTQRHHYSTKQLRADRRQKLASVGLWISERKVRFYS